MGHGRSGCKQTSRRVPSATCSSSAASQCSGTRVWRSRATCRLTYGRLSRLTRGATGCVTTTAGNRKSAGSRRGTRASAWSGPLSTGTSTCRRIRGSRSTSSSCRGRLSPTACSTAASSAARRRAGRRRPMRPTCSSACSRAPPPPQSACGAATPAACASPRSDSHRCAAASCNADYRRSQSYLTTARSRPARSSSTSITEA
eukprot:112441-Pleurochrysis_carterae.AAC.1